MLSSSSSLPTQPPPSEFYKFRSLNSTSRPFLESLIVRNEVYLAPATTFNDPFELRPHFSLEAPPSIQREDYLRLSRKFQPHLSEVDRANEVGAVMSKSLSDENRETTRMILQALTNEFIRAQVGIFCITKDWSNILMWSHYADQHRGICVEFDATVGIFAEAQRVAYAADREAINIYERDYSKSLDLALLTKSADWSYEQEWRFLDPEGGPGLRQLPNDAIRSIILGVNISYQDTETVRAWNRLRVNPVPLKRAELSQSKYFLELRAAR